MCKSFQVTLVDFDAGYDEGIEYSIGTPMPHYSTERQKHNGIIFIVLVALLIIACGWYLLRARNYIFFQVSSSQVPTSSERRLSSAIAISIHTVSQETPIPGNISPCHARAVKATVLWHGALGTELGSITYTNISKKACLLFGYPTIQLKDSKGPFYKAKIQQNDMYGYGITDKKLAILQPGQDTIQSDFAWQGCTTRPKGIIDVYVTLPHDMTPLLIGNNEAPMTIIPFCPDNATPSITSYLVITPFELLKR